MPPHDIRRRQPTWYYCATRCGARAAPPRVCSESRLSGALVLNVGEVTRQYAPRHAARWRRSVASGITNSIVRRRYAWRRQRRATRNAQTVNSRKVGALYTPTRSRSEERREEGGALPLPASHLLGRKSIMFPEFPSPGVHKQKQNGHVCLFVS